MDPKAIYVSATCVRIKGKADDAIRQVREYLEPYITIHSISVEQMSFFVYMYIHVDEKDEVFLPSALERYTNYNFLDRLCYRLKWTA